MMVLVHTLMNTPEDCIIISYCIQQQLLLFIEIIYINDAFIDIDIPLRYPHNPSVVRQQIDSGTYIPTLER